MTSLRAFNHLAYYLTKSPANAGLILTLIRFRSVEQHLAYNELHLRNSMLGSRF